MNATANRESTFASLMERWIAPRYRDHRDPAALDALCKTFLGAKPFPHIRLEDVLLKSRFVALRSALMRQPFERKDADLFSFYQTDDLLRCDDPVIREFILLLRSKEFTDLIAAVTGIRVKRGAIDAAGFIYAPRDHLLCHDDRLESRRVAYILQLSGMMPADGGALCLYDADTRGRPRRVVKRVFPRENTLVLFAVSPRSHHAVEEVRSSRRISVAGWFHG